MLFLGPVRTGATVAIGTVGKMFGIESDIYYPKGGFSRGGRLDDVKYADEPDLSMVLTLIDPYSGKFLAEAGAHTNFGGTYICFVTWDVQIYRFSKIVAKLGYTIAKYKVEDIHTHHDTKGPLYKKLELSPLHETLVDEEIVSEEHDDYVNELNDASVLLDNSLVTTKDMEVNSSFEFTHFKPNKIK